jgi:hypothetical protein
VHTFQRTYPLVLFLLLLLSGCDRDEWTTFYQIDVASDYPLATEEWIFATDADGNLLDVKRVEGRDITIQMHTNAGSLTAFTLHHVTFSFFDPSWISVNGNSYTDVPVGGTWHLKAVDYFPEYLPAWVKTNGIDGDSFNTSVSSVRGNQTLTRTATGNFPTEVEFKVSRAGDFLVSRFYNGRFLYGFLHNVEQSTHSTITLKEIDQPLIINLPVTGYTQLELAGYHNGDDLQFPGYINSVIKEVKASGPITMGYVNGFDIYRTFISYRDAGPSIKTYEKRGAPLTLLPEFEEPTFSFSSGKMSDLTGSISIPYHYATLDFSALSSHHQVRWAVWWNGESNQTLNYKLPALPAILLARFPVLATDPAELSSASFFRFKDEYRYTNKLNELSGSLMNATPSAEYFAYKFEYY